MLPEELNLDEAFLEPEDMEGFVNRAMFRDAEFSVKRIGGTPDDPKFTYHTLNFKGPNWFGWIRIAVVGKAWRHQAARWFTINVFARRLDGPMFMAANERNETAVDLGKDFLYGKIKELPTPESLYPYLEAALDGMQEAFSGFEVEGDEDVDRIVYTVSLNIISYLKGAHILNEAIDPDEFMAPVINQGGFRPLRWKLFRGHVARGNEKWAQDQYTLPVTSFDDKIHGSIVFTIDHDNPDDLKKGDGLCRCSATFGLSTGSFKANRQQQADYKRDARRHRRLGGGEPMHWIPSHSEAWLEASFRAKPEWVPTIKKCYELLVTKYWRPLLDDRDTDGEPMLKSHEEALRKEFREVFDHQNEIGESINLTPGEFEEFGEVAADIQFASAWRKDNGGINNRFVELWVCDLACPTEHPFTGYVTVYKSTEEPYILHVGIKDQYTRGKYIVGYFKAPPTERILDKVRQAALQQIKAYVAGEDAQGNAQAISSQFAAAIQSHISGDPEVYALNYTEKVNESIDDIEGFVDDFLVREGLQEWQPQGTILNQHAHVVVNTGMGFKFDNLLGVVSYLDYWQHENRVNMVHVNITDSYAGETWERYYGTGDSNRRFHINVPENQVENLKEALELFIGRDVRAINREAVAAGSTLLPNQSRRIAMALRKAMRPWVVVLESVDPESLWGDLEAHGGTFLEWYQDMRYERKTFRLDIPWLDQSHRAVMTCSPMQELGERTWNVGFAIERNMGEGSWDQVTKFNSITKLTPNTMPQFQARTIEFAKWLIKTFGASNPLMGQYTQNTAASLEQVNEIKKQFDMATNWTGLKEMLEPEEFLSNFDLQGVMRPWQTIDYTEHPTTCPHIYHGVVIEHPDKRRLFNDKVTLSVDYYLSHATESGMPTEPYVLITGSYAHRGWSPKDMKPITVMFKTDKEVLPVVDEIARRLLLPKIAKNAGTPGMFTFFRRKLASRMAENGWLVEAFVSGRNVPLKAFAKYWLDRDGQFFQVEDHEEADLLLPDDGWQSRYNTDVEIDYKYQEAIKRGFVRVTTDNAKVYFNPPATDFQRRVLLQAAMEIRLALVADYGNRGERIIWQPMQEALDLTFRSECVGAHNDQTDMVTYAELDGQAVGRIEYTIFRGSVHVQFIKTQPGHRRQGIATALAKWLQAEYPETEIEWSASTPEGSDFIGSLNREFDPNVTYEKVKAAYDQAKAEYDALQAAFDKHEGPATPEMLAQGERMNELDSQIYGLEQVLREMKPGKWMIREGVEPEEFYQSFEHEHSVQGWTGSDINTSTSGGAYLYVNRSGILGRYNFNAYIRPQDRNDTRLDSSFQVSCWSHSVGSNQTIGSSECPDIWLRLSPTEGMPSFQPSNINGFLTDFKQAAQDFAKEGCSQQDAVAVSRFMFIAIYKRLKKQGWKMDVDKHGGWWDLGEAIEWSPDDMADIARRATSAWGEWQELSFHGAHGQEGVDWIFHIYAPEGKLYQENNYIRLRFYRQEPGKDVILGNMSAHFVSPNPYYAQATAATNEYVHVNFDKQFIIKPGEEADFRKAVEAEFQRTVGQAVLNTPANQFSLSKLDQKVKMGFTRLIRRFWPPGAVWM